MTREFIKLKKKRKLDNDTISRLILTARSMIFKNMGFNMLDELMIEKIVKTSENKFPLVIIADIYLTNKVQGSKHLQALHLLLDEVVDIVFEQYNSLVSPFDKVKNTLDLKNKIIGLIDADYK